MSFILSIFFSYGLGSISFALLTGKLAKGVDIRQHGSGNLGATNVFRVVGKKWGIFVLALDILKGYGAVVLPGLFLTDAPDWFPLVLGVVAIAGHTFPFWLSFRGGKGVATSLGVFLAVAPIPTAITFGLWVLFFILSRIISVASIGAAFVFPVVIVIAARHYPVFPYLFSISLVLALFILYTHRTNLKRILKGEEPRLF